MTGTLFLDTAKGWWILSTPTTSGFRHHKVARLNGTPTLADAERRLAELVDRGEVAA